MGVRRKCRGSVISNRKFSSGRAAMAPGCCSSVVLVCLALVLSIGEICWSSRLCKEKYKGCSFVCSEFKAVYPPHEQWTDASIASRDPWIRQVSKGQFIIPRRIEDLIRRNLNGPLHQTTDTMTQIERYAGALPTTMHVSKKEYLLPQRLEPLVRRNLKCSEERRKLQHRMSALKANCKATTAIPDDELATIKQTGPTSQAGRCFLGCMMEGMNIIEGGSFAAGRAERLVVAVYAEGDKRRSARVAVRTCAREVTTTEKCETGGLIFECFQRNHVGLFGVGS